MKLAQEIVMFSFILVLLVGIGSCINITEVPPEDPDPTTTYDVTFTVRTTAGPLPGALVRISGSEKTSGSDGRAVFTLTGSNQAQTYAVTMDGYRSLVGSIVVDRDVSRTITLQPYDDTPNDPPGEPPEELDQARIATLTVSGEEVENPGANAFDGNMNTRWSADVELNDGEQYLELTFAEAIEVGSVRIWWYKGAERTTDYAISTGTGQSRTVHSEGTAQRAAYHDYAIEETVSVLRITGFGSSEKEFASISEVQINGQAPDTTGMSVTVLDSGNEDPNTDVCLSNDDCQEGYLCTSEGECVAVQTGCTDDTECESGEACMNGACVPIDTGCTKDAECGAGLVCSSAGTCVAGVSTPLLVSVEGTGNVRSASQPAQSDQVNCGGEGFAVDCLALYPRRAVVTFTATPSTGYVLDTWSGCTPTPADQNVCTKTISSLNEQVTARFVLDDTQEPTPKTLWVTRLGSGTITSTSTKPPATNQIDCESAFSDCTAAFPEYTTVTLTATPNNDWTFSRWSGACTSTEPTCTIELGASNSVLDITRVTGTFTQDAVSDQCASDAECDPGYVCVESSVPITFGNGEVTGMVCVPDETVDVVFDPPECGSANGTYPHTQTDYEYTGATTFCASGVPSPSNIAYPAPGATVNWQCSSGNCEVQGTFTDAGQGCVVETVGCSASRAPSQDKSLSVLKDGSGTVTSTSSNNQIGQINCGSMCARAYPHGTSVTLTATPATKGHTVTWSGNCQPTNSDPMKCTVSMDAHKTVNANFVEPTPTNYVAWTYIKRCRWGCRIETDTFSGKLVPGQTASHEGTYTITGLLSPSCGLAIKVTNNDGKISCSEHYRWGTACEGKDDRYAFTCREGTDRTAPPMPS